MEANEKHSLFVPFPQPGCHGTGLCVALGPQDKETFQWAAAPLLTDCGISPSRLSLGDLTHFQSVLNKTYSHLTHPAANQILPPAARKASPHIQLLLTVSTTESSHWRTQLYSHLGLLWPQYSTAWVPGTTLLKKT